MKSTTIAGRHYEHDLDIARFTYHVNGGMAGSCGHRNSCPNRGIIVRERRFETAHQSQGVADIEKSKVVLLAVWVASGLAGGPPKHPRGVGVCGAWVGGLNSLSGLWCV